MRFALSLFLLCALLVPCRGLMAGTTVEDLKREVEDLRRSLSQTKAGPAPIAKSVDSAVAAKYGPNVPVTTRNGRLEIGGLLQVWNYNIMEDHLDVFGHRANTVGAAGTNETRDNSSYRIRRAELRFQIDIHENVTAVVMIDPAREATSFAPMPSNQGLFKSQVWMAPEFDAANGPGLGSTAEVASVQTGAGSSPFLLQDAYINYHGVVPHHDFTIGQFKPKMGEEGTRNSAYLDFAERAMITQINDVRDLGVEAHGAWWDQRVQYWLGAFDGAGDYFGTAGQFQNRSDDNDYKDFLASVMVRPLWNHDPWGCLELGYSGEWGRHGESASADPGNAPLNGLNRKLTNAIRQAAWVMYKPMGPVRGWWLRSECGYQKDRALPLTVNAFNLGSGPNGEQTGPNPFARQGWYFSTGYKLADSIFADRLSKGGFWNKLFEPVEFAFRYETFGNVISEDLAKPDTHTDVHKTNVWTAGVNYYVKAYNMRIQVNYLAVDEQEDNTGPRNLREVKNNVLLITYQVSF